MGPDLRLRGLVAGRPPLWQCNCFPSGSRTKLVLIVELDPGVRSVAIWLVLRSTAAAERHPITHFVRLAVRRYNGNSSPQPDRTAAMLGGIFNQSDRHRQVRFYSFSRLFVI